MRNYAALFNLESVRSPWTSRVERWIMLFELLYLDIPPSWHGFSPYGVPVAPQKTSGKAWHSRSSLGHGRAHTHTHMDEIRMTG